MRDRRWSMLCAPPVYPIYRGNVKVTPMSGPDGCFAVSLPLYLPWSQRQRTIGIAVTITAASHWASLEDWRSGEERHNVLRPHPGQYSRTPPLSSAHTTILTAIRTYRQPHTPIHATLRWCAASVPVQATSIWLSCIERKKPTTVPPTAVSGNVAFTLVVGHWPSVSAYCTLT